MHLKIVHSFHYCRPQEARCIFGWPRERRLRLLPYHHPSSYRFFSRSGIRLLIATVRSLSLLRASPPPPPPPLLFSPHRHPDRRPRRVASAAVARRPLSIAAPLHTRVRAAFATTGRSPSPCRFAHPLLECTGNPDGFPLLVAVSNTLRCQLYEYKGA
ncbi:hypothetical protein GUJ93_ZPchr0008g13365 [Zizania palustris]|uniref:Uncharacterized protein n=1 Tax=Zizania palustris TaxID=103762 RepID=A0A8J5VGS1_ZIZPA|nr:hypothetical protein GUJ93_ZPchr0008g13365 [Zizania palustris]